MPEYTIAELSALTGINRRNIHFYIQQGLLPPADGAGLGARYSDDHLFRLQAIPVLRQRGLRLDAIREQLAGMNTATVHDLLTHPITEPTVHMRSSTGQGATACETVLRYRLAPDVELLVGPSADPAWHRYAAELVAAINQDEEPPTDF